MSSTHSPLTTTLIISLTLHGLILFGIVPEEDDMSSMASPIPLRATVIASRPQVPAALPPRRPERPAPRSAKREVAVMTAPALAVPGPQPTPVSLPPPAEGDETPKRTAAAAEAAPPPTVPAAAPVEPRRGYDAEALRRHRLALAIQAKRFKNYPPLARERGWEGRTELKIRYLPGVPVPQVSVEKSSGHALLDDQAVATIRRAALETPLSAGLVGWEIRFTEAFVFEIDGPED